MFDKSFNPFVYFSLIDNIHDSAIRNHHKAPWFELVDFLFDEKHLISDTKDVTCISPWKYKTTEHADYVPQRVSGEVPASIENSEVSRVRDNVIGTSLLMFDYDGTLPLSTAGGGVFSTYAHFGYTSFSHMSPSKDGKDCFRIMLPLASFVTAEQLLQRRKAIYAQYPGLDTSCLSLSRSFYIPSCPAERQHLAYMWKNHGEFFDVLDYEPEVFVPSEISAVSSAPPDQQKIISALKSIYLGHEPDWYKVALAMCANGFSYEQFCNVTIGGLMREKNEADCRKKWKSAQTSFDRGASISIGYLINLCKQHGTW